MENKKTYNDCAAALTWEMLNGVQNIGKWELEFEDGKIIKGEGFEDFLNAAAQLPKITVIYVKHLRWLIHVGSNFINYGGCPFFASVNKNDGQKFFYISIDNIEFREWNNFFKKVEDKKLFLELLNIVRTYFNKGLVNRLGLEKHCKTTFSHDMWADTVNKYYLYSKWNRNWVDEMLPNDMDEWELYEDYNKGGFYFANPDYKDKIVENVHQYDIKSSYLSSFVRRKFPVERFRRIEDDEEIQGIIRTE